MVRVFLLTTTLVLLTAAPGTAQTSVEERILDLTQLAPGQTATRQAEPGVYRFTLKWALPKADYNVSVQREFLPIAELTLSAFRALSASGSERIANKQLSLSSPAAKLACVTLLRTFSVELDEVLDEASLKAKVDTAKDQPVGQCGDAFDNLVAERTVRPMDDTYTLGEGQRLRVTITRILAGQDPVEWVYVMETDPAGEWRTSYGFTFAPNEDRRYFAKATDTAGKFTIEEQEDRERLDYIPSILFTFIRGRDRGKEWSRGWTAGLGYDLEKPVLLAGYAWTLRENLTFTAGLIIHQQTRLLGRYDEGDPLNEQLEASQLVESTYGPNAYVGVSFRFGTNDNPHARTEALNQERIAREKRLACVQAAQDALKAAETKCAEDATAAEAKCPPDGDPKRAECLQKAAAEKKSCLEKANAAVADAIKKCK